MGANSSRSAEEGSEFIPMGHAEKNSKEDLNASAPMTEAEGGIDDGLLGPGDAPSSRPELPEGPVTGPGVPAAGGAGGRGPFAGGFPRHRPVPQGPSWKPDVGFNDGHVTYTTKKNIAQGMMDLALLTANASQLRYVLRNNIHDTYHIASVVLISLSIALQLIVGVALIFIGRYDYKQQERRQRAQTFNNVAVALVFFITVINVFIAVFGVDDERAVLLLKLETSEILLENCKSSVHYP